MLSVTTDYVRDDLSPGPYLRRIADAGFKYVHWCHHWASDFLYGESELAQIETWFKDLGLRLNEIHGSDGCEKAWGSDLAYERQAGIELVKNRIDMAHRLGGKTIVMHTPARLADHEDHPAAWDHFRVTLDRLEPYAQDRGIRIALENLVPSNFDVLDRMMSAYSPRFLGICYDSGHGNITGNGLDRLDRLKDRLIALHLNDNDGRSDQHRLIFSGTVDWQRLATIISASCYDNPVMTMEVVLKQSGIVDEDSFLEQAKLTGQSFEKMVDGHLTSQ